MGAPKTGNAQVDALNAQKEKKTWSDFKRGVLAVSSLGTSEIKTGGGEYGDETLADSLFPKTVNDLMSDERTEARKAKDAADAAQAAPARAPDLADKLLSGTAQNEQLRQKTRQGRSSAFISGAWSK